MPDESPTIPELITQVLELRRGTRLHTAPMSHAETEPQDGSSGSGSDSEGYPSEDSRSESDSSDDDHDIDSDFEG